VGEISMLRDAGLIREGDELSMKFWISDKERNIYPFIEIGDEFYRVERKSEVKIPYFEFPHYLLSVAGKELSRLINAQKHEVYFPKLKEDWMRQGYSLEQMKVVRK
jgi:hypothetical protein